MKIIFENFHVFSSFPIEIQTLLGVHPFLYRCSYDTTGGPFICAHERYQANNNRLDIPSWIPWFRVVVTHTHAYPFVHFKSAIWRDHLDTWWFERIFLWKYYSSKVVSSLILTIFESPNDVVPPKNIVWIWMGQKIIKCFPLANLHMLLLESYRASWFWSHFLIYY